MVTETEVLLQYDVVLTNSGSAPARDVLVEAKMVPAHAGQDQEIAAFFQYPQATGDRMARIPPFGKVSLKSAVRLPIDSIGVPRAKPPTRRSTSGADVQHPPRRPAALPSRLITPTPRFCGGPRLG